MDTAQGTFQLSTLPFATLHDVVQSEKKAQPLCFRIYRPQALHWQEQCFTLATSMAEFSTAAVDPFDSDDLRLEALKRAWKGAKTRLANWQLFVSDFYCRKGMKKKPLICMSFAVACQGFLPVEAIFAATLGFRLRQCGNQLAILAQNYGMDQ